MPRNRHDFILLSGRANPALSEKIARILKLSLDHPISFFADGEIRIKITPNLRRKHVFIIQPTSSPVNDNIMGLVLLIDAAKRASAQEIIAVVPYFGYSRQDRKEISRVPISASVVAGMLEHAGVDHVLTLDIHSEQEEGFIRKPWDNVYASYSFVPELKKRKLKDLIIASPDRGGVMRATGYARLLGAEGIAIVYKERDITVNNRSESLEMVGDVKGKNVLIVDDILDTGGTLVNAANFLKKRGAKTIRAAITHGLFSGHAIERVDQSEIKEVIITDSVAIPSQVIRSRKITVVSVAPLLAEAIRRIYTGESISRGLIL